MAILNELTSDNNPYDKDGAIDWLLQELIKHGGQKNLYTAHGRNSPKSNDIIGTQDLLSSQGYIRRVHNAIGVTFAITEEGKKYFYKRIYDKVVARLVKASDFIKVSSILTALRIEDEEGELSDAIEVKLMKEDKVFATEEGGIMLKPSAKNELLQSKFGFEEKKETSAQHIQNIEKNYGIANQGFSGSDNETNQSVTMTLNKNDKPAKIIWYKTTLFMYVIFPIIAAVIAGIILYLILKEPPKK